MHVFPTPIQYVVYEQLSLNSREKISDKVLIKSTCQVIEIFLMDIVQTEKVLSFLQQVTSEHTQTIDSTIQRNVNLEVPIRGVRHKISALE